MSNLTADRTIPTGAAPRAVTCRRAFSLTELVVVMVVVMLLASILMPALRGVQEHAQRMFSASNMRQIGMGLSMYASDNLSTLPASALVQHSDPAMMQEMMAVYIGEENRDLDLDEPDVMNTLIENDGWEGIGLLYRRGYFDSGAIFYCPSHRGDHPLEKYIDEYDDPTRIIYSNYHYRGQIDHDNNRISLATNPNSVLVTDGMRTKRDFNHKIGYNSLFGDGSVYWRSDTDGTLYNMLPDGPFNLGPGNDGANTDVYQRVWDLVDKD